MKYNPRRPLDDHRPDLYLESDDDYFGNNRDLILELLKPFEKASAKTHCKCGSSLHTITGGGEYFKKLPKSVTVCVSKSCPYPRPKVNLTFK